MEWYTYGSVKYSKVDKYCYIIERISFRDIHKAKNIFLKISIRLQSVLKLEDTSPLWDCWRKIRMSEKNFKDKQSAR